MTDRCVRSSVGPGFDSVESFFFLFFLPPLFFLPLLALDLHFFFPLLFLSSSNFFLPFPPAFLPFFFLLFFSHSFSFFFYFLFPPFCSFSFSLSSLYFILLISSSFSSPLSFSFFFFLLFFSSLTQNDDFLWFVYSYDRSNGILTDQTGF